MPDYVPGPMWPLFEKGLELFPDNMELILDIIHGLNITEEEEQKEYFKRILADPNNFKICKKLLEGENNGSVTEV